MTRELRDAFWLATALCGALGCAGCGRADAGSSRAAGSDTAGTSVAGATGGSAGRTASSGPSGASAVPVPAGSSGVSSAAGAGATSSGAGSGAEAGSGASAAGAGASGMAAVGSGGSSSGAAGSTGGAAGSGAGTIWMPKPGVTWQWQLSGTLDTSLDVQMYDIDLFGTTTATIQALHSAGRRVVCYFSAGSYEPDRPDSDALAKTGLGSTLDGWPDEKWLDIRSSAVRDIMKARLDLAASKGCDGVEPDNVDGYDNSNGLGLTEQNQVDYNQFLASEGHSRKLSVGLKNSLGLVTKLVGSFDWALNEECLKYDECSSLTPFISAGKAVFHCEYASSASGICDKKPQGFSTIIKNLDLDAFRIACP
jgi:PPE-repeat protein